jgi:2-succinyl-5-enolpyruvyl-6-hydroxy-3-cyclohexene-1-carboxylate synthase
VVAGRQERGAPVVAPPGVPVLADALSGARHGANAVAHYDALLRDARFAAAMRPDLVLRAGDLPTSKPLRAWLAGLEGVPQWALDPEEAWQDPAGVVTRSFGLDGATALRDAPLDPEDGWLGRWRDADARAAVALDGVLGDELNEPNVARALATSVPADARVVVAASMPVRDVETFWPAPAGPGPAALANRGANGIDGTLATGYGVAAADDRPAYVLLGDVAFAHDVGALLTAKRLGGDLTVVVVDNDGGGIFDFLPVSTQRDHYEEHVLTPTGLDVARAAALYGAAYLEADDLAALHAAVSEPPRGTTIVRARTDRAANVALHRRCWEAVAAALRE